MGIVGACRRTARERYARPAFIACLDPPRQRVRARVLPAVVHIDQAPSTAPATSLLRYGGTCGRAGFSPRGPRVSMIPRAHHRLGGEQNAEVERMAGFHDRLRDLRESTSPRRLCQVLNQARAQRSGQPSAASRCLLRRVLGTSNLRIGEPAHQSGRLPQGPASSEASAFTAEPRTLTFRGADPSACFGSRSTASRV